MVQRVPRLSHEGTSPTTERAAALQPACSFHFCYGHELFPTFSRVIKDEDSLSLEQICYDLSNEVVVSSWRNP